MGSGGDFSNGVGLKDEFGDCTRDKKKVLPTKLGLKKKVVPIGLGFILSLPMELVLK